MQVGDGERGAPGEGVREGVRSQTAVSVGD